MSLLSIDAWKQIELWQTCLSLSHDVDTDMTGVFERWMKDLTECRHGYPLVDTSASPYVEDLLIKKSSSGRQRKTPHAVFLTHDVDYLYPTFVMWLKNALGRGKIFPIRSDENFINSLEEYLEVDRRYTGSDGGHLFIPTPLVPKRFRDLLAHWVVDPSYRLSSLHAAKLRDLVERQSASIGLHGSFFSLTRSGSFEGEIQALEAWSARSVVFNRQHWLNISRFDQLLRMYDAGIRFDSSLGWNGKLGFRGGFARPYPIYLGDGKVLWEIPMILMDGVLFDEMKLTESQAFEVSIKMLSTVRDAGGCVALNWHERTRTRSYGWGNTYDKILNWCQNEGFLFYSGRQMIERIRDHEGQRLPFSGTPDSPKAIVPI